MLTLPELLKQHPLYPEFIHVKSKLQQHQFVCWIAGGAVRDLYLGNEFADIDLVTDANTENLKCIFPEALLIGEKFGVLKLILANGKFFDLATFRQESDYEDGRRPSSVSASTPLKDALRRDFSVNALFWDDENQVLRDYVGGKESLLARELKAVGNPIVRFNEDYLRIIRLFRLAAQLDFKIESETGLAAQKNVSSVQKINGERVAAELKKLNQAEFWNYLMNSKLFHLFLRDYFNADLTNLIIYPFENKKHSELSQYHLFYVLNHLRMQSDNLVEILKKKLRFSNEEISIYSLMNFALNQMHSYQAEAIAFEMVKKGELKNILQYLIFQNSFPAEKFELAKNILSKFPKPLISGHILKDKIESKLIGEALDKLRILQFREEIKSEEEALGWIKKQFATKS